MHQHPISSGTVRCAGLAMVLLFASTAAATPIVYTFRGNGSGTVGASSFTNADYVIRVTADTSAVVSGGAYTVAGVASMTIAGIGTAEITEPNVGLFAYNPNSVLGFTKLGVSDYLDLVAGAFGSYPLSTEIGPVGGLTAFGLNQFHDVASSLGAIAMPSSGPVTFEAAFATATGSYRVDDGASWEDSPPTYTCRETCALLFGGSTDHYSCSTVADSIDHQGWASGFGTNEHCAGGGTPVDEDFKQCAVYDSPGCFSAYVQDSCDASSINYCFSDYDDCGDGVLSPGEACDDGNLVSGDGCDTNCTPSGCGNGIIAGEEDCEDGNLLDGDCCSSSCQYEAPDSPCDDGQFCTLSDACDGSGVCSGTPNTCSDGEPCTIDSCNEGADTCVHAETPRDPMLCFAAPAAKLQITDSATSDQDKLSWQWKKGEAFAQSDLGTPDLASGGTTYTLCIYDETASMPSLEASIDIAPSTTLWVSKDPKGFLYKDKSGSSEGVAKVQLKPGAADKTKLKVSASGSNLVLPAPAGSSFFNQNPNVVVQLISDAGKCWTSTFAAGDTLENEASAFKAQTK